MNLKVSESYAHLIDAAQWSHSHGRNVFHITQSDIDAARLFSYAYRSQAIGTFHATRIAVEERATVAHVTEALAQARMLLAELEAKAGDPVPRDFRALVSTLYFYDQWVNQVAHLLEDAWASEKSPIIEKILENFVRNIELVCGCNGIYLARDLALPEQGAFLVPNLGISILPLIYGDHHSWNAAFLAAGQFGVSVHRHMKGAEIHLGFTPVRGHTILGSSFAEVSEGYAMPIPPMTDHGFRNSSGHDHILPFVFGSMLMTGWGVFFDVEARSNDDAQRELQPLTSPSMNRSVFLDRAIRRLSATLGRTREVLIEADRAGSPEIGGLELAVNSLSCGEVDLSSPYYRIVSIQSGNGRLSIGGVKAEVGPHDHFGIPTELSCCLTQAGPAPLIYLDVAMLPVQTGGQH